jgi:hypothetical protein
MRLNRDTFMSELPALSKKNVNVIMIEKLVKFSSSGLYGAASIEVAVSGPWQVVKYTFRSGPYGASCFLERKSVEHIFGLSFTCQTRDLFWHG